MKNKVLIGIIIILVGVLVAEGIYLFTSKEDEKENNSYINIPKEEEEDSESNGEISEDYVKLVNTKEKDNQVIQEYEMVLNGKYQEFDITFEINIGEGYWDIGSILGDSYLFDVWYDTDFPDNPLSQPFSSLPLSAQPGP